MDCCSPDGLEKFFTDKTARRHLKKYNKIGPDPPTTRLLQAIPDKMVLNASVMDIGGGIGAIQLELLKRGASAVVSVDASKAYLAAARKEAEKRNLSDKIQYFYGDFLQHATSLPDADIVTLDKVLCCSHEPINLIRASASKCRRFYGIVIPKDRMMPRIFAFIGSIFMAIKRNPFRFRVHNVEKMEAAVQEFGFNSPTRINNRFWLSLLFEKN